MNSRLKWNIIIYIIIITTLYYTSSLILQMYNSNLTLLKYFSKIEKWTSLNFSSLDKSLIHLFSKWEFYINLAKVKFRL